MDMPWYQIAFGPHYSDLYAHRDRQDARRALCFVDDVLGLDPTEGRVLDLCCGEGRHSLELLERHPRARVTGIDLSEHLLDRALRNSRTEGRALSLVRADMRTLPILDGVFTLVLNLFTSFGYFREPRENRKTFLEVGRVLRPGGAFVFDHINPAWLRNNLKPETARTTPSGIQVRESRWIDEENRRVEKRIEFESDGCRESLLESVRLYEPEEVLEMGKDAGLDPLDRRGDFDGRALTAESPRAIYVFGKN